MASEPESNELFQSINAVNEFDSLLQTILTDVSIHITLAPHRESPASGIHSLYNIPMLCSELLCQSGATMAPLNSLICALKRELNINTEAAATLPPELYEALLDEEHTYLATTVVPDISIRIISQVQGFRFLGPLRNATTNSLQRSLFTDVLAMDFSSISVQSFLTSYERSPFIPFIHHQHFIIILINAPVYAVQVSLSSSQYNLPSSEGGIVCSQRDHIALASEFSPSNQNLSSPREGMVNYRRECVALASEFSPSNQNLSSPREGMVNSRRERVALVSHPYQTVDRRRPHPPLHSSFSLTSVSDASIENHWLSTDNSRIQISAPLANTIREACEGFDIPYLSVQFEQHRGVNASLFEIVQLCQRAGHLLHALGYRSAKGSLASQSYTYMNGRTQSFSDILAELGWNPKEYIKKRNLFSWAEDAVQSKSWKNRVLLSSSREKSLMPTALKTWRQMVYLWGDPGFIATKQQLDPRSKNAIERDAARLRQKHMKDFRSDIENSIE
ncbi:hypothetical protein BDP27DRAFT_1419695 [Rhodocollybia butyracea]|uniref:Uncharacterized protein n=1 Tax=Rhodocollybia butyracea TaxID=206335 RepID=A0A9P5PX35_9AGAR|nr:hypothetical protein BDP27DRAFT_1419695 [Rhodocollybia butyracea]